MHKHHPTHWLGIAVVVGLALLAFEAAGQTQISPNANAIYQGRPYMSGAQAGQGAQAGLPQGGIGLQGSDGAARRLGRPQVIDQQTSASTAACADVPRTSGAEQPLCLPKIVDERLERREAVLGINPQQR
jgi:hypothetical protein